MAAIKEINAFNFLLSCDNLPRIGTFVAADSQPAGILPEIGTFVVKLNKVVPQNGTFVVVPRNGTFVAES